VILSKSDLEAITTDLTAADLIFKPTELEGRCHSVSNLRSAERLRTFSDTRPDLQFLLDGNKLLASVRSNVDGRELIDGPFYHDAIDCILFHVANWRSTMENAVLQLRSSSQSPLVILFGLIDYFPPSITY
jgi:hypothetical protein